MKFLYIVLMRRWGSEEDHHYIEGVYSSFVEAEKRGALEKERRDHKYEFFIEELVENETLEHRRMRIKFQKQISKK